MSTTPPAPSTKPATSDAAAAAHAEIAALVQRARAAQEAIAHYTQEQVDALVLAVGWSVVKHKEALARAAHDNVRAERLPVVPQAVPGSTPQAAAGRYRIVGKAPDGRAVEEALLLFARGTLVVQVTALASRLPGDAVDTFVGSIRAGP